MAPHVVEVVVGCSCLEDEESLEEEVDIEVDFIKVNDAALIRKKRRKVKEMTLTFT